jgi:GNAT superfamily N-acetyltransferase
VPVRIFRWDQADLDVLQGCYQAYLGAVGVDDPRGPRESARGFRQSLVQRESSEAVETWVTDAGDGTVAGWYSLRLPAVEDRHVAFVTLLLRPQDRRRGLGTQLLQHAVGRAATARRSVLAGEAFEGTAGDAFARRLGATPGVRDARTALDVTALAPGKIADLQAEAAAAAGGYSLVSWTGPVPEAYLAGYARVREAMNDAPSDFEAERWDEQRVRMRINAAILASGQRRYTVAAVDDVTRQLAAYTALSVDPDDLAWGLQNTTVVAREHRGHRLGLLVKTAMLQWLATAEPAVQRIETGNAAGNKHMIAINERLGFTEFPPAWQLFQVAVSP